MKVQFHSTDPEGAQWRGKARRELQSVMRRLQSLVRRVRVELDDANGPLPGVDKRCRVRAELPGGTVARIDVTTRTWQSTVEIVARRLRDRVLEHLHDAALAERGLRLQPALAHGHGSAQRPLRQRARS